MKKGFGNGAAWYGLFAVLCVVVGISVGLRMRVRFPEELTALKVNAITFPLALAIIFSVITWFVTLMYVRKRQARDQKVLARKAIKQSFELLARTNRVLRNLDVRANLVVNSGANGTIDKAFVFEAMQSMRDQLSEVGHGLNTSIADWRDVLPEEFDKIEKRERLIGALSTERLIKSLRLKELEKDAVANEKEILAIKAEMVRLADRQRVSQVEIIQESRDLVGAPISVTSDLTRNGPTQILIEQTLVQQLYLNKECAKAVDAIDEPIDMIDIVEPLRHGLSSSNRSQA